MEGREQRRLVRVLRLARQLAGVRYLPPLKPLAREHGVHVRTLYRYIGALEEAGWIAPIRDGGGRIS